MTECRIRVQLFGTISITADGAPVHLSVAGATRGLMQYLFSFPDRPLRREMLAEIFWPRIPFERRRSTFNTALSRIRNCLRRVGDMAIDADADQVRLRIGPATRVDAHALVAAVQSICRDGQEDAPTYEALALALDACQAPFLDGVDDEWAVVERERLTIVRLRGMGLMMRIEADRRHYEEALQHGRSILAIDPFRESTLREVMWLHVLNGERPRALRVFEEFSEHLDAEMGIAPTAETIALREHIALDQIDFGASLRPAAGGVSPPASVTSLAPFLQDRLDRIEESRREVYRSLRVGRI